MKVSVRRNSRGAKGVDLSPMLDVIFQLILFFLVSTTFSVWYREATWANIYRKSEEIRRKLKSMNTVKYDKGCICITSGSPMITFMGDVADDKIKRAVFNIEMCFIDLR